MGYKIAASSSEVSGTWTNAQRMIAAVYRGASGIGASALWKNSLGSARMPALTLTVTNGTSWVVGGLSKSVSAGAGNEIPTVAGMTHRQVDQAGSANDRANWLDTNGGVAAWIETTLTNPDTSFVIVAVELVAAGGAPPPVPSPGLQGGSRAMRAR